jgi:hypothetical protein
MVIFRMEGWSEMESKKLKKWEKQIHRLEGENRTRCQTRIFQRYKQGALVYLSTVSWTDIRETERGLKIKVKKIKVRIKIKK